MHYLLVCDASDSESNKDAAYIVPQSN